MAAKKPTEGDRVEVRDAFEDEWTEGEVIDLLSIQFVVLTWTGHKLFAFYRDHGVGWKYA